MISRANRAKLMTTAGAAVLTGGTYGAVGWPPAVIVAGAYLVGFGLIFMDTDDKPGKARPRVIER